RSRRLPERCVELLRRADLILHVGDFTAAAVLEELRLLARVEAVHGNVDEPELRSALPERLVVQTEGLRIGLTHDAGSAAGRHERLRAWFPRSDLVAYGHTHHAEVDYAAGGWIVNPGSPTERRRAPARTMIVIRAGRPELIELE